MNRSNQIFLSAASVDAELIMVSDEDDILQVSRRTRSLSPLPPPFRGLSSYPFWIEEASKEAKILQELWRRKLSRVNSKVCLHLQPNLQSCRKILWNSKQHHAAFAYLFPLEPGERKEKTTLEMDDAVNKQLKLTTFLRDKKAKDMNLLGWQALGSKACSFPWSPQPNYRVQVSPDQSRRVQIMQCKLR